MSYPDTLGRTLSEHNDEKGVHLSPPHGQEVCDFCLTPWRDGQDWTYPVGEMKLVHPVFTHSDDPWAICQGCHELIQAEQWDGLIERAMRKQAQRPPAAPFVLAPYSVREAAMRTNVNAFKEAINGEPYQGRPR